MGGGLVLSPSTERQNNGETAGRESRDGLERCGGKSEDGGTGMGALEARALLHQYVPYSHADAR